MYLFSIITFEMPVERYFSSPGVEPKFKHLSITPIQFQSRASLAKWGVLDTGGNQLIKEIHGSFKGSSFWSRLSLGWCASSSLLWAVSRACHSASIASADGHTPAWPQCFLAFVVAWRSSPLPPWLPLLLRPFVLVFSPALVGKLSWFTVTHGHTWKSPGEAHAVVVQEEICGSLRISFLIFLLTLLFFFILVYMKL